MNRLIGLSFFFTGIGMVICLVIPYEVMTAIVAALCLLLGYHLFCR